MSKSDEITKQQLKTVSGKQREGIIMVLTKLMHSNRIANHMTAHWRKHIHRIPKGKVTNLRNNQPENHGKNVSSVKTWCFIEQHSLTIMVLLANSASIATRKNHFVSVCETKHPFFFHKNCTSQSTLEMSKNKQLTFAYYCILICGNCPVENAGNGISETLNLKIFWGSMPPDSPRFGGPSAC